MEQNIKTAGLLVIGDEILSGRTKDTNTNTIATRLTEAGITLREARTIPDVEEIIVAAVREYAGRFDYVFTTGGIGPTHDDRTAQSVATAFNVPLLRNDDAIQRLARHYGGAEHINDGRARMANIPQGAALIDNPVSAAPGFIMGNVHVMAGVPHIMVAMLDNILPTLAGGDVVLSRSVVGKIGESYLAQALVDAEEKYAGVSIGSYPRFLPDGPSVAIVARGVDEAALDAAIGDIAKAMEKLGVTPAFEEPDQR